MTVYRSSSVYLTVSAPSAEISRDPVFDTEAETLLALDDDALLDAVARDTFDYFWLEANPQNGLIKDRSTEDSPASIAAVGFGLSAIPLGIERGWISYDEGYERTLTTLKTFSEGKVQGEHGFFYHWIDMETGNVHGSVNFRPSTRPCLSLARLR